MSSLARRTLRTSATVAGIAALGAGFAGQAFAADLPELPATPELPTEAPALPDASALEAPALPAAPELPEEVDVPGILHFEAPEVSTQTTGDSTVAQDSADVADVADTPVAEGAGAAASDVPTGSYQAAEAPTLLELQALPGAPEVNGDFGSPLGNIPLAGPELPDAPEVPAAPELAAPELPSTTDQDLDTTGKTTVPTLAAPSAGDIASEIAALAG